MRKRARWRAIRAGLQQVVWNLLSNAIKFTPKGGRVQVILKRVNSAVELSVTDTGQGITPEFMPFIVRPVSPSGRLDDAKDGGIGNRAVAGEAPGGIARR